MRVNSVRRGSVIARFIPYHVFTVPVQRSGLRMHHVLIVIIGTTGRDAVPRINVVRLRLRRTCTWDVLVNGAIEMWHGCILAARRNIPAVHSGLGHFADVKICQRRPGAAVMVIDHFICDFTTAWDTDATGASVQSRARAFTWQYSQVMLVGRRALVAMRIFKIVRHATPRNARLFAFCLIHVGIAVIGICLSGLT